MLPEPGGDDFGGGGFEAGDVVEVVMVELGDDGRGHGLDISKVHHPRAIGVERADEMKDEAIGVAVEPVALVRRREVGEPVRGVEGELAEDLVGHGGLLAGVAERTVGAGERLRVACRVPDRCVTIWRFGLLDERPSADSKWDFDSAGLDAYPSG